MLKLTPPDTWLKKQSIKQTKKIQTDLKAKEAE